MNLDDHIRRQLHEDTPDVDAILDDEPGLFGMMFRVYRGTLARWALLMTLITLLLFGVAVYAGVAFFSAGTVLVKLHWGLIALLLMMMVGFVKLWFFIEMNRESTLREVKRMEIAIERLAATLEHRRD
jgi:hypothetical protein